jgi:hypothetical protein
MNNHWEEDMLYLAHFSFEEEGRQSRHGYFTTMADADGVDGALNKFHTLLTRLKESGEIFDNPTSIYLDEVIQIKKVPSEGFLGHLAIRDGELPPCTSISLPEVDEEYCEAFATVPEAETEEGVEIDPFIVFE